MSTSHFRAERRLWPSDYDDDDDDGDDDDDDDDDDDQQLVSWAMVPKWEIKDK